MRLRILLKYLDDQLEAKEARDVGRQLQQDEATRDLIEQISTVIRRRRLTAPDADPKVGLPNANLIAEYLDQKLDPNETSKLEGEITDSEMLLAEVASVHQVMSLTTSPPDQLSAALHDRAYRLVGGSGASRLHKPAVMPTAQFDDGSQEDELATTALARLYRTVMTPLRTLLAVLILSTALFFVVRAIMQRSPQVDGSISKVVTLARMESQQDEVPSGEQTKTSKTNADLKQGSKVEQSKASEKPGKEVGSSNVRPADVPRKSLPADDPGNNDPGKGKQSNDLKSDAAKSQPKSKDLTTDPSGKQPEAKRQADAGDPSRAMPPSETPAITKSNDSTTTKSSSVVPPTNVTDAAAKKDTSNPPMDANKSATPSPANSDASKPASKSESASLARLVAAPVILNEPIAFRKNAEKVTRLIKGDSLQPGDLLIYPGEHRLDLQLPNVGSLSLLGPSRMHVVPIGSSQGLQLAQGNALVELKSPTELFWQVSDSLVKLETGAGPTKLAISIVEVPISNAPASALSAWASGLAIRVLAGSAKLATTEGAVPINGEVLVAGNGGVSAVTTELPKVFLLDRTADQKPSDPLQAVLKDGDLNEKLRGAVVSKQRDVRQNSLAALLMIDDFRATIEALRQPDYPDLRQFVITRLRQRLRIDPAAREQLLQVLPEYLDGTEAQALLELLLAYPPQQSNKAFWKLCVDSLSANELSIRELAIENLSGKVGNNFGYAADAPPTKRNNSAAQWKKWLTTQE